MVSMVEHDTAFSPECPLELAWLADEDEIPCKRAFHPLDKNHLRRLEFKGRIPSFLQSSPVEAEVLASICVPQDKGRELWGQLFMIYKHCAGKHMFAGILAHSHQPVIRLEREYHWRGDGEVIAVLWNISATGNYAFSRFFYANEPC